MVKKVNIIDTRILLTKKNYYAKINEIKGEIPSTVGVATNTALNVVDNKIPDVSNLIKKTDYDAKISDIESKNFTTSDRNKFTNNVLDAKK